MLKQFDEKRPLYARLALAVTPLLEQLAADCEIAVFRTESRVKDRASLERKLARPDKSGKYNHLSDVTDLCGVRVVLFTNEDCEKLTLMIREHFLIDEENSIYKLREYDDDRFGYLSIHLIASLPESRTKLFEFRDLDGLKFEVQVRTVLQHAWAVLDWKLRYKSEIEVPKELRRKLFRISALLEAADEAFSDIEAEAQDLRIGYEKELKAGNLDIPINLDSLKSFISSSKIVEDVFDRAERRGVIIFREKDGTPETPWTYLIKSLSACGINRLDEFESNLRKIGDYEIEILYNICKGAGRENIGFGIFTTLRILMISLLPSDSRLRVSESVPTTSNIGEAEKLFLVPKPKTKEKRGG